MIAEVKLILGLESNPPRPGIQDGFEIAILTLGETHSAVQSANRFGGGGKFELKAGDGAAAHRPRSVSGWCAPRHGQARPFLQAHGGIRFEVRMTAVDSI